MLSLRARLSISYAVFIGIFLAIVGLFVGHFFAEIQVRQVQEDMDANASVVRTLVAANPLATADHMRLLISKHGGSSYVTIRFYPSTPPDLKSMFPWPAILGLHRIRVPFNGGFADVLVNVDAITPMLQQLAEMFSAIALVVVLLSWWLGRLMTREAIRPLIMVTDELRRFAAGDFTPRSVTKIDGDEFGELTAAYNAAAAQVAAAFEEHVRVEEQMKRFVADASHELRTPLTVISGYLDILKKMDPNDSSGHERAFRTLNVETRRVRLLVDRLVVLARLEQTERAQREVLDVRTVINDVVLEVTAACGTMIELVVDQDFEIVADLADVYDSVRNLIENSVKYGEASVVRVEIFCTASHGCVRVGDGGPGVPEHERPHLFERFFRGERRANIEGSGLGLSIVARAMLRSNGSVTLESAEPGDTRFLLCFQRSPAV